MQAWVDSVVEQALDRDLNRERTEKEFMSLRRLTVGALPCFDVISFSLDLPDTVMNHPKVVALNDLAVEMVILPNVSTSFPPLLHNPQGLSRTSILTRKNWWMVTVTIWWLSP